MRVRVSSPFSPAPPVVPPPFSAAAAAEGEGNPGSGGRLVNRVWWRLVGGGVGVGAASLRSAVLSRWIRPSLVGAWCNDDGSVRVLPREWRGGGAVSVLWGFRPRACCRRAVVSSFDGAGLLRYACWRFIGGADGAASEGGLRVELEGSGLLRPDLELGVLGAHRRPTFFCVFDPVRWGWWLLRSIIALWLGVLLDPWVVDDAGGVQLRWREVDDDLRVVFLLYSPWVFLYVFMVVLCILTTL